MFGGCNRRAAEYLEALLQPNVPHLRNKSRAFFESQSAQVQRTQELIANRNLSRRPNYSAFSGICDMSRNNSKTEGSEQEETEETETWTRLAVA